MNIVTLLVGMPSTGKTTSARNLGADAFIINVEKKPLPFKKTAATDYHLGERAATPAKGDRPAIPAMSAKEHMNFILENLKVSNKFQIIVIDSFSALTDKILAECKHKFKGFDIWNAYNSAIYEFFQKIKDLPNKFIFVISHVENLQDADGNIIIRTKAKGKEWEGLVEKEVTCVLYSRYIKKEVGNGVNYQFVTNSDGYLPGKTPMGMFDVDKDLYVENDLAMVVQKYKEYYNLGNDLKPVPDQAAANAAALV